MIEHIPSESGDYSNQNRELEAADFAQWEQELSHEPHIGELNLEMGRLSLEQTVEYEPDDDAPEWKVLEDEPESEDDEEPEQEPRYDPLKIEPGSRSHESGSMNAEEGLFGAAMALVYFTTGFTADEVFEK